MARLAIVVCGAPLASRTPDLTAGAAAAGWDVALTVTRAAEQWTDASPQEAATRHADALLVCPLTFNTANKWALGIADTEWLGVLNESLAAGTPTVAVPMVNETLWRHPAWVGTLTRLASSGVTLVDPATGDAQPRAVSHGSGEEIARSFDPSWVLRLLR
jgi:phosphopantothenoylcysteine synthetase/decarboxylase